jgi:hypothetical protein
MSAWSEAQLRRIGDADELELRAQGGEGGNRGLAHLARDDRRQQPARSAAVDRRGHRHSAADLTWLDVKRHRRPHAEHRPLDGVAAWRLMLRDRERQVELALPAAAMLAQLGTEPDRTAAEHLGRLDMVVPLGDRVLIGDVLERLLGRRRDVGVLIEAPYRRRILRRTAYRSARVAWGLNAAVAQQHQQPYRGERRQAVDVARRQ